jgi:acyl carrier protein
MLLEKLKKVISVYTEETNITKDIELIDLGIDSLAFADIIFDIEDKMEIIISDEEFEQLRNSKNVTVGQLCEILEKRVKNG